MTEKNIILLPLDGSDNSLSALLLAKSIAKIVDMRINAVHISDEELNKCELISKLKLKEEDLPQIILNHKSGSPAKVILEECEKAKVLVMSTHGETNDLTKTAGSVTLKLMENAKIPIILIKPNTHIHIEDELWAPKKILMPINGTPESAQVLLPVLKVMAKVAEEIELLHISCAETATGEGCLSAPYYQDYQQHEWPSWSKEFIKRFCEVQKENTNHVKLKLTLANGNPAQEIIKFSQDKEADLIAIAWHGKIGSLKAKTLQAIMRETPCPILLLRIDQGSM